MMSSIAADLSAIAVIRRVRRITMCAFVSALAASPGCLHLGLRSFAMRKLLGVEARIAALRALGATIGQDVYIGARVVVRRPANLTVGDGTSLGGRLWIDSWLPVAFGKDVLVNDDVAFLTMEHDVHSPTLAGAGEELTIGDHAWLSQRIIVLPGAHIGACAVVGAGSVVTKPVAPYAVVAGNPARPIKERARHPYTYRASALR